MATCPRTHRHTHTIKPPTAGVQQVGHTSINDTVLRKDGRWRGTDIQTYKTTTLATLQHNLRVAQVGGSKGCSAIRDHLNCIMGFRSSFQLTSRGNLNIERLVASHRRLRQLLLCACNPSYRKNLGICLETGLLQFPIDLFTNMRLRAGTKASVHNYVKLQYNYESRHLPVQSNLPFC